MEDYSYYKNQQQNLMKVSKLLQYHFLFLILSCELDNCTFKMLF